jgi:CBS domain-containing protein
VVGLVNVMDVIYGCGGAEGWRSIFGTTLDLDDLSETASHWSERSNAARKPAKQTMESKETDKSVSKLRPKKVVMSCCNDTVLDVIQQLTRNRGDAAILVDLSGNMAGIITDTDFTRRVVSKGISLSDTMVSEVMTPTPKSVMSDDSATDALVMMVENRFRHLPVVDGGKVVGILDIAKCLNDAITKLERSGSSSSNMAEEVLQQALQATSGVDAAALQALLHPLLSQAFGSGSQMPTLRRILDGKSFPIVSPESNVLEAAELMAHERKAALVVEDGELVGIFSFRDLMTRVASKQLDPSSTAISAVMTPDPEFVNPDMNALEALQMMHDNKFLTLPVCEDDGSVVGLVDVMDVIHGCGDAEHWRSIFEAALEIDDVSDTQSAATPAIQKGTPAIKVSKDAPMVGSAPGIPGNIPSTLEFEEGMNEEFDEHTLNDTYVSEGNPVVFKVVDHEGHTHRLKSDVKILHLRNAFAEKTNLGKAKANELRFKFFDEEGDAILVSTDEDLAEAVNLSRTSNSASSGKLVVKLVAELGKDSLAVDPMFMAAGATIIAVALGAVMLFTSKPTPTRY